MKKKIYAKHKGKPIQIIYIKTSTPKHFASIHSNLNTKQLHHPYYYLVNNHQHGDLKIPTKRGKICEKGFFLSRRRSVQSRWILGGNWWFKEKSGKDL